MASKRHGDADRASRHPMTVALTPPPSLEAIEALAREHRWRKDEKTLEEFCADEVGLIIFEVLRVIDRDAKPAKIRRHLAGFMRHAEYWNSVKAYTKSANPIAYFWHWAVTDALGFTQHVRDYMHVKSGMCEW